MSDRTPMPPVKGLTKTQRGTAAAIPGPPARPTRAAGTATGTETVAERTAPAAIEPEGEGHTNVRPMRTKPAAVPKPTETDAEIKDVTFTLPMELRSVLRERARVTKDETIPSITLAAIEANLDDLARLVTLEKGIAAATGLFPDPTASSRSTETRVPQSMRVTSRNLAVVDQLVTDTEADDRSQLLTAALRAYL